MNGIENKLSDKILVIFHQNDNLLFSKYERFNQTYK
jgi:hypothetical protein